MSPLEDTIVALRPVIPGTPFEVPNSVRNINPMMPTGDTTGFNNVDPQGNPTAAITNQLVNFGWEYVYHCHILSHEEMDMMRPVSVAVPPIKPVNLVRTTVGAGGNRRTVITWTDSSITETSFVLQRTTDGTTWTDVGAPVVSPLDQPNTKGTTRSVTDSTGNAATVYGYRVLARNTVGYGGAFPSTTVQSASATIATGTAPVAPSGVSATLQTGGRVNVAWVDNSANENGFTVQRSADAGTTWTTVGTAAANVRTYADTATTPSTTYVYRVGAFNGAGPTFSGNSAAVSLPAPAPAPTNVTGTAARQGGGERITVRWTDASTTETGFVVQWSTDGTTVAGSVTTNANVTSATTPTIARRRGGSGSGPTNLGGTSWSAGVTVPSA